jgi:hypothetical protein
MHPQSAFLRIRKPLFIRPAQSATARLLVFERVVSL